ncbi:MAG: DUF805 domain-containing protein [Actinomycetota bacterium]
MPVVEAWKLVVLQRYAKFDGRSGRAEYWWFFLANIIIATVLFLLSGVASVFFVLYVVYGFAMIVPSIAVGIRRLHDTNKTGWLLLLTLIPLVGGIILIVLFAIAGDEGANKYGAGPDPATIGP